MKMKLLQELGDRFSSANPPKPKFTDNYTSCFVLLHYIHGFTDPETTVDADCACVPEIV